MSDAARPRLATRGFSIGQRLTLIVLAIAIPMLLLSAAIVWRLAEAQRGTQRDALMYSARSISSGVDAQLGKYVAVVQALAASLPLKTSDLVAFREEAEQALPSLHGAWVTLTDVRGQQVVNTLVPAGEHLPLLSENGRAAAARAFETKRMQITDVTIGALARAPVIAVGVPIFIADKPAYYLTIGVDVTVFRALLNSHNLPEGWIIGVIGRRGNIVARSRDHDRFVGQPGAAGWLAIRQQDGIFETVNLEGLPVIYANVTSQMSGWSVSVAAEKSILDAPIRQIILTASLVGSVVTLSIILFAARVSRSITAPIKALETSALLLQRGEPVSFAATGVPEVDHALHAFDTASKALRQYEEQRTQAEMALKESEQRLRLLINGTKDYAIFMLDPNGRVASWNEGAHRLKGYEADEIIGRHVSIFYTPDDIAAGEPEREIKTALLAGTYEQEGEHVKKNGTRFWASIVTSPILDESGRLKGFAKITRDITERRIAEQQLAALTGRLRATVDTAVDAIIVIDEDGVVQSVNPSVERIFGYQADEVVGKNVTLLMPEPHRSQHGEYVDAYRRTRVAKIIGLGRELEGLRKDGTTFPVDLAVAEWRLAGKLFFTGIMRDITKRKQAEEHTRMIMRELSHRTKNVLAVVQVMTWQTSSMDLDPKDFAERLTQRIDALVRSHDLLTKGEWQGVSLEELIRSQIAPFLDRDNERLAIDGPALHLQPDAAQTMGLALHELGTNATKYGALSCPTGRIEIEWTIEPDVLASRRFHMEWREFGGPEVNRPNTKGYGSTIIKNVIEAGFDGEVVLEFTPHGFTWQLTASTDHMFVVERRPTDSTPVEANS